MKLFLSIVIILIVAISFMGLLLNQKETPYSLFTPTPASEDNSQTPNDNTSLKNFTASFEIYTNGTKRIFTQAMYHNQSPDVYIENPDPSIIHIKKADTTWNDFFDTLPFSLNRDCLVTGTQQTFCSTETKKLRFFLNGAENPNTLESHIKPNDNLRVTYEDESR